MKKQQYRLKQWYPSLPKAVEEGDIANLEKSRSGDKYYIKLSPPKCIHWLDTEEVENNPQFWEPVEEKNYEICAVRSINRHDKGTVYKDITSNTLEYYLKSIKEGRNEIYSVKRLSDGKVFTIGDKVMNKNCTCVYTINEFEPSTKDETKIIAFSKGNPRIPSLFIDDLEHVKEKGYEILTVYSKIHKSVYDNKEFKKHSEYYLNELDTNDDTVIHSIKRLSDGQVFTIGDNVEVIHTSKRGKIESFEINDAFKLGVIAKVGKFHYSIKYLEYFYTPLFRSHDGVNIYEGDKYYEVRGNGKVYERIAGQEAKQVSSSDTNFSTEEKAREYIDNHKLQYSKADIENALENSIYATTGSRLLADIDEVKDELKI